MGRVFNLEQQCAGPFEAIERIGKLSYRSRLSPSMRRIHRVISIAHREPAYSPDQEPSQYAFGQDPILSLHGTIDRRRAKLLNKRVLAGSEWRIDDGILKWSDMKG